LVTAAKLALSALPALLYAADSNRLLEAVRQAGDFYRQGQPQEADKFAAEAISILETRPGPPDFAVASSFNNLGSLLYAQGDLDRAERFFTRSRDAYLSLAGASDPRLATALYNLAGVHVEKGRYNAAEPLYRQALAIREQTLGPADPLLAEVWNGLGFLCLQQRKYSEAAAWLEKAANLWQTSPGMEAFAAVALANLARLRRLEGRLDDSESLYQRALAAEETKFGADHPELATTLVSLAALYRSQGNREKALGADRRALALLERSLGEKDPLAVEIRARLRESAGEYQILLVRTQPEADDLRRKIEAGEEFAQLAARYSIDPSASGGGFVQARLADLRPELRARLEALKPGEISSVFPLDRNWAIVRRK
jgi:tetratricopeptide (TPR) repeat protein